MGFSGVKCLEFKISNCYKFDFFVKESVHDANFSHLNDKNGVAGGEILL